MSVQYLYPNGAKTPTQAQMQKIDKVHARVSFGEHSPAAELVHNMQFDVDAPPEALQTPLVIVNAIGGGPLAPPHVVSIKDGNTLVIGKGGTGGAQTDVIYDVWVTRVPGSKPAGEPPAPKG